METGKINQLNYIPFPISDSDIVKAKMIIENFLRSPAGEKLLIEILENIRNKTK